MPKMKPLLQRPLTALDLSHVSQRITSAAILQRVAAHLGVPDYRVRSILYDHRHYINNAAWAMLSAFWDTVGPPEDAFTQLEEALWKSGLRDIVEAVLAKPAEGGTQTSK